MTAEEFVIWLKGFIAGSNNYNLTPQGWESLKQELEKVNIKKPKEILIDYHRGGNNIKD